MDIACCDHGVRGEGYVVQVSGVRGGSSGPSVSTVIIHISHVNEQPTFYLNAIKRVYETWRTEYTERTIKCSRSNTNAQNGGKVG